MNRQRLIESCIAFHSPNPAAISIVFNRHSFSHSATQAIAKRFQAEVDERRLGGRWYQKPASERLAILASPELFDAGHPHYHGLIRVPADDLERYGFEGVAALYNEQFAVIHEGGSLLIKPLTDPERWVAYCSKETDRYQRRPFKGAVDRQFPAWVRSSLILTAALAARRIPKRMRLLSSITKIPPPALMKTERNGFAYLK